MKIEQIGIRDYGEGKYSVVANFVVDDFKSAVSLQRELEALLAGTEPSAPVVVKTALDAARVDAVPEDTKPPKAGKPPKAKPAPEPEPEEEEEEEEDEEEEEEEEEEPAEDVKVKLTSTLKKATKLREVVVELIGQGIKTKKGLYRACVALKEKVECLGKVADLEARVYKAAEIVDPTIQ